MQKIYSFDELNLQKVFEDSIEINDERYKLIKVIDYKDKEICEKILDKKGISKCYFIKTKTNNIGIFISCLQFNKVYSFLQDENIPNSKIRLSDFIKEYDNYSFNYISNIDDMKLFTITNIKKENLVLENFEDITKSKAIYNVLKKYFFIHCVLLLIVLIYAFMNCKEYFLKLPFYFTILVFPFMLTMILIEILDKDKKKFKIENFEDKILINDTKEILHKDIMKVYIEKNIYLWRDWSGRKIPKNVDFKFRPGFGYEGSVRKVLVIEYNNGYSMKKIKFQLKYVNEETLAQFLDLFRTQPQKNRKKLELEYYYMDNNKIKIAIRGCALFLGVGFLIPSIITSIRNNRNPFDDILMIFNNINQIGKGFIELNFVMSLFIVYIIILIYKKITYNFIKNNGEHITGFIIKAGMDTGVGRREYCWGKLDVDVKGTLYTIRDIYYNNDFQILEKELRNNYLKKIKIDIYVLNNKVVADLDSISI